VMGKKTGLVIVGELLVVIGLLVFQVWRFR